MVHYVFLILLRVLSLILFQNKFKNGFSLIFEHDTYSVRYESNLFIRLLRNEVKIYELNFAYKHISYSGLTR